jgi:stage V sporulation protein G
MLEITNVTVFPVLNEGKFKAFARICLNDALQLTSLRVYQGTNGLFVSYPNDPNYKGDDYKQLFYPITREFREIVEKTILDKYQEEMEIMEDENYATAVAETMEY